MDSKHLLPTNDIHSPGPGLEHQGQFPNPKHPADDICNVNIVEMVNICCTHSSISRYRFPSFSPPGSKPYLRAGWRQWHEAWCHTTGNRLFGKNFPMTEDQGRCPHLTQGPGGSGLMVVYLLCPLQALGAVTRRLDPSQALSGKFQTSPVIPQIICCELSVQSHLAQGIGQGGNMCRL